ncbi:MAG: hypothetical protein M3O89_08470 [Actinomycetota bacterium]|nr:hypothetical protein [Actinomycetota bacterium]
MRSPLHPPTELIPEQRIASIRAYLERQSRIDLAVWVRHEQKGVDGPLYDHHLMLGMDDADDNRGHPDAILFGVENEGLSAGWVDLFPLSEVEKLREFGYVVWERDGRSIEGLDPLDFYWSFEAIPPPGGLVAAVAAAVEDVPAVVRVELTRQCLCKADREVWIQTRVFVVDDEARGSAGNVVKTISELLAPFFPSNRGVSLGRSVDPGVATTTLFNRSAERTT